MTHDYHDSLPGYDPEQLLVDGCRECEARASSFTHGIDMLDPARFARAWHRAHVWQASGLPNVSRAELPMLAALAAVQYQLAAAGALNLLNAQGVLA